MRKLSPAPVVTAVVMACSAAIAHAQTVNGAGTARPASTNTSGGTTASGTSAGNTLGNPATVGTTAASRSSPSSGPGCLGTNGSTCTTNASEASATAGSSTTASPSIAPVTVSGAVATEPGTRSTANGAPATSANSANAASGVGTTARTDTSAIATTTSGVGVLPGNTGFGVVVPSDANGNPLIGSPAGNLNGVVVQVPPNSASMGGTTIAATPLLDQVTRNATARDNNRRNQRQEPRIIGIAPRTDADRTDQMPDDKVIRY